jgi:hypothetical protein
MKSINTVKSRSYLLMWRAHAGSLQSLTLSGFAGAHGRHFTDAVFDTFGAAYASASTQDRFGEFFFWVFKHCNSQCEA